MRTDYGLVLELQANAIGILLGLAVLWGAVHVGLAWLLRRPRRT
jgi:hypothetical protein